MASKERRRSKFDSNPLRQMVAVGEVGPTFARIWMRSEVPGAMTVVVHPYRKAGPKIEETVSIDAAAGTDLTQTALLRGLRPRTRYSYRVVRRADNAPLGSGRFETFPQGPADTPDKVSIALMSCHQPFSVDDFGVHPRRMRLLKVVPKILREEDVKFILLAGDQLYSDVPNRRSLFYQHYTERWNHPAGPRIVDWDATAVRQAYQERYRLFWSMKEVQDFYANYPCYPILDDHEIVDDWGAKEIHSTQRFANVRKGAREAYFDYQGGRVMNRRKNLPASFHYAFQYGNVGVFVLDLRSQRKGGKGGQLIGQPQFDAFTRFLARNRDQRVLLIMSSVPVIHLPEWLSDVGGALLGHQVDFPDHWSYRHNRPDRDRFLKAIYDHQVKNPKQRVIIVSGDVHVGCAFAIAWQGRGKQPLLYQFTSSAISNLVQKPMVEFLELGPQLRNKIKCRGGPGARASLLPGTGENPFGGLNIGIIDVFREENESPVAFRLLSYPDGVDDRYEEKYATGKL